MRRKHHGYSLDDQVLALMFMDAFQRDYKGKMIPNFTMVGRWFGYPKQTMHTWWQNRQEIMQQKNTITEQAMNVVQLRLSTELLRMTDALSRKDYDTMSDKDFTQLLNTVINKIRLLGNLSTTNVEHKHGGGVELVMPTEK